MRPLRLFAFVVASVSVTLTPALAEQRGQHPASATHPATTASKNGAVHHAAVPVSQQIADNPALVARLQPLLPTGMTLASAADGFRNEGQFIAALHVSQDLKIPFAQLKAEMIGSDHDSLGQAIHDLQPTADAKTAAKTAEREARTDIKTTKPLPVPVAQRIADDPALVARLQPLLPTGMTLASAADGFRSERQFIAALHASQDLKIPFAQLKAEMTGSDHDSLGHAIHDLQPTVNAQAAVKTAEQEARADINATKPTVPNTDKDDK